MKWFIGTLVVVNLLAALYGALKQKPEVDIHAQEVNATRIKLLPADWQPPALASAPQASTPASAPLAALSASQTMTLPASAAHAQAPQVAKPQTPPAAPLKADAAHASTLKAPAAHAEPALAADAKTAAKAANKAVEVTPAKAAPAKPAEVSAAAVPPAADKPAAATARLCYSWGGLDPQQLARVQGGLPLLKLATAPQASVSDERRGSGKAWVFYPPLATQAETQTLVSELKGKGFDSYIVKTDGEFKGHLSLGLFGREEGAQALVKRLKAAGYDKARVDSRGDVVKVTTLTFRQLDETTADKLKALQKRLLPGRPLASCR